MINTSPQMFLAQTPSFSDVFDAAAASVEAFGNVREHSDSINVKLAAIFSSIEAVSQNLELLEDSREAGKAIKKRFSQITAKIRELQTEVKAAKLEFAKSKAVVNLASTFAKSALLTTPEQTKMSMIVPEIGQETNFFVNILSTAILPRAEESINNEITLLQGNFKDLNSKFSSLSEQVAQKLKVANSFNHTFKELPNVSRESHSAQTQVLENFSAAITKHQLLQRDPETKLSAEYEKQRAIASSFETYTPQAPLEVQEIELAPIPEHVQEKKIKQEVQEQISDEPTLEELDAFEQELLKLLEQENQAQLQGTQEAVETTIKATPQVLIEEPIVIKEKPVIEISKPAKAPKKVKEVTVEEPTPKRVTRSSAKKAKTVKEAPAKRKAPTKKKTTTRKKAKDTAAVDTSNIIGDLNTRSRRSRKA